ncbi:hypothetical protein KXD93_27960 [Mucilaginibacter sp. BJC16-A38]|uniref:hypothetical protein n=1 Tax=Mucilaginibacter phenanthrenivorans TaxID=1234842 RepID=UPI002157C193|nr:hypothetical protein [Mucilaginibacter phenanthrenivorans]MCR8561522.1 hypothetical protein [Mucilaginibacter phenanthrenivorans]
MEKAFYVYIFLLLLISIAGITRYKKLTRAFQLLVILMVSTLISETIKKIVGKIYHNSMPLAHIWAVIEFCFFSYIYYNLIENARLKKIILLLMPAMLVLEIINLAVFESLMQFPSAILNISQIVYVIYSLFLFSQMLLNPSELSLFKQSLFWFNLNILFYGTTMFLNYALTSYFIQNKLDLGIMVGFSFAVNYIFYIVIGISIFINNKQVRAVDFNYG